MYVGNSKLWWGPREVDPNIKVPLGKTWGEAFQCPLGGVFSPP